MGEKIIDGSSADRACEFFWRFQDDLDLCRSLNLNSFRLSLNWPALVPSLAHESSFDEKSCLHYRKLLEEAKSRGMTTFVTLFHFCLPKWLSEVGGWNSKRTVEAFERYAQLAAREFGHLVDYWLTLNEPLVYVYQGYVEGRWPPGYRKNYLWAFEAVRKMLEGHSRAYQAIHTILPDSCVSFTIHWRPFFARNKWSPFDQTTRYFRDQIFNHLFPLAVATGMLKFPFPVSQERAIQAISGSVDGLKGAMDFLAFNYFTREICEFKYGWPIDVFGVQSDVVWRETTDMGWEIYPEGLYYLLTEDLAPYRFDSSGKKRPIFITENGMASKFAADLVGGEWSLKDDQRVNYLISHLMAVHQAIREGANVKGYLHWSLTDNFEWADGLSCRFGLVRVSYPDQSRKVRKSGRLYADIAGKNALDLRALEGA